VRTTISRLSVVLLLSVPALSAGQSEPSFVGIISDDMCALNHASMRMGPTDADCAHACVDEHDGVYVLVGEAHVYKLSDQPAAKALAGKKARVAGTLDEKSLTITVRSIREG
jgi:hypothetical protein